MDEQQKLVSIAGKVKDDEGIKFTYVLLDSAYLPVALVGFYTSFDTYSNLKLAVVHLAEKKFLNPMLLSGMSKSRIDFLESSIPAITKVLVEEGYLDKSYLN